MGYGFKQVVRLKDLQEKFSVLCCTCNACKHTRDLQLERLVQHCGGFASLDSVIARLLCAHCGRRDVNAQPEWRASGGREYSKYER